jgi:purine-binding chemotaxis protein CheW
MAPQNQTVSDTVTEYVTVMCGGQLFGLPIARVQDVFKPERLTRVPLAPPEVAGLINLRGRVVTAIDMRCCLGLPPLPKGQPAMAVGIEFRAEAFGLLIDAVGEVLRLADEDREANPINLDPRLARVAAGVYRLDGALLVELDVDRMLEGGGERLAA